MVEQKAPDSTAVPIFFSIFFLAADFRQALFQKAPFRLLLRQFECHQIGRLRFRKPPDPAQQVGLDGMGQMVTVEISTFEERLDKRQPRFRPVAHRHGHGSVQQHDRRGLEPQQGVVEPDDLCPVCRFSTRRLAVQCSNGRL